MTPWLPALLSWYRSHQRLLPWRCDPTPYRVWISEVMLQQTQVTTVQPYFERFLSHFPTLPALARADLQDVLKCWEGLGYYRRARNLHRAAAIVCTELDGEIPSQYAELKALPGIGEYTAAAIASIAFGRECAVVDGNVARVFARFWALRDPIDRTPLRRNLAKRLTRICAESGDPSSFNQAVMELGALLCRPRDPDCDACPLAAHCLALARGVVQQLPVKNKRRPVPHYNIAAAIIEHEGRVLIARRDEDQMLGGLWEFPGGKQETGESLPQTAVREVKEETGLEVRVVEKVCTVNHAYSHFRITLTAFRCEPIADLTDMRSDRDMRWVDWAQMADYPFPKANHKIFKHLDLPES